MKMAARIFVFFVRHAALCRPLSQPAGRLKLARDCADIERIVSQAICGGEAAALLGAPYRALRAFRPLLFVEPTTAIESSPLLAELPLAVVLHHLYARAPDALVSPHVQSGLSPAQYSRWLDQHSERDLWGRVQASLDSYYNKVKEFLIGRSFGYVWQAKPDTHSWRFLVALIVIARVSPEVSIFVSTELKQSAF